LAEDLALARAYPHDGSAARGIEHVQTHLSHVYLSGARAWKLRKAVQLGFVDFSTRAERNADCAREVLLNRRLAPDVYLGVAPIERAGDGFRVGRIVDVESAAALAAAAHEFVVAMRRLPAGRDARSLLERGALRTRHIDAIAERLARFHAAHGLGVPAPFDAETWRARMREPVLDNLRLLDAGTGRRVPRRTLVRVRARALEVIDELAPAFEARRLAGRAVDGHGDVHLQHVWFEAGASEPIFVDCIEFRDDWRQIDAAAEIAFPAMDLRYCKRPRLAARLLRRYATASDDFDLYRVVDSFISYRAAVRAKVAALAAADPEIAPAQREAATRSARRHLSLADRALRPRAPGSVVLMTGLVGSGKSSAAARLADAVDGVVIASDRVRKHLSGLAADARELYDDAAKDRVYAALLARAEPVTASGRVAILDATYARDRHRQGAIDWARSRGLSAAIVETRCQRDTALLRLARRAAAGSDASDAGPEQLAGSESRYEPPRAQAGVELYTVATDEPGWRERVRRLARTIRTA
jgi:aminoglycoside phosphotransferase family enzyme/predicted kinase